MLSLISRNIPKSLWGQTALMGAVTVCYGFVIGWFAGWMAKRRQARP